MHISLPPNAGGVKRWDLKKQAATRMTLFLYLILHFLAASAQQKRIAALLYPEGSCHNSCHFEPAV
ncbi:hypothetical protein BDA96_01G091700 [Sorghum bicolor]|uniref:Uncharacterized protein n=2 Tax=Sorghum bicolor TaxID=4558 RepID=A0A921UY19_SORBI|nr:hypothetical protein BDA96_01G091700 [Sorghum bicolor]OQU90980.1 hypothetical protein SORBI_3001G087850 [Sorghum bicolor]